VKARNRFHGVGGGPTPCKRYARNETNGTQYIDRLLRSPDADADARADACERGSLSITPWLAVKMWELNNEFALQDHTATLYPYGEVRGWPGTLRQAFEVAAHRSGANSKNFAHQTEELGSYHSASWYHTQLMLNSGMRAGDQYTPQDWFYTPVFVNRTSVFHDRPLASMALMNQIKMYQNLDTTGPDGKGTHRVAEEWWVSWVNPSRFDSETNGEKTAGPGNISNLGSPWKYLAEYQPGLQARVSNALLRQYLNKQKTFATSSLPRSAGTNLPGVQDYGTVDYIPNLFENSRNGCFYSCPGEGHIADDYYRSIPRLVATGVDPALINELIDWSKQVWPRGNWDALRP
jgi:hypothetical protein